MIRAEDFVLSLFNLLQESDRIRKLAVSDRPERGSLVHYYVPTQVCVSRGIKQAPQLRVQTAQVLQPLSFVIKNNQVHYRLGRVEACELRAR